MQGNLTALWLILQTGTTLISEHIQEGTLPYSSCGGRDTSQIDPTHKNLMGWTTCRRELFRSLWLKPFLLKHAWDYLPGTPFWVGLGLFRETSSLVCVSFAFPRWCSPQVCPGLSKGLGLTHSDLPTRLFFVI